MTKKIVKFTVEIECYEDTVKDAARALTLDLMSNGDNMSHLSASQKIGYQVARKFKEGLVTKTDE